MSEGHLFQCFSFPFHSPMWEGCAVAGERVYQCLTHQDVLQTTTGPGSTELVHLTLASAAQYPKTGSSERLKLQPTGMVRNIKITKGEGEVRKRVLQKRATCSYKHIKVQFSEDQQLWAFILMKGILMEGKITSFCKTCESTELFPHTSLLVCSLTFSVTQMYNHLRGGISLLFRVLLTMFFWYLSEVFERYKNY